MTTAIDKIAEFDRFGSILGLERVEELLHRLGDPHKGLRYIHVVGTNGKGSVCKYLEKGLAANGYKVGLYTSPYIERFNERIQFDGKQISDEDLEIHANRALEAAKSMVDDGLTSPTEFEVVAATAFSYFADKADENSIFVMEAGMGGLGDATNVIENPMACVFTGVAFDHMQILGNTLAEIATDKAGIIKDGAPVISNVKDHEPAAVIARTAYQKGSRLYDVSDIKVSIDWETPVCQQVSMNLWGTDYSEVEISMVGEHQAQNLKTALATLEVLRKAGSIKIERSRLYAGLKEAVQPGRIEVFSGREAMANGECWGKESTKGKPVIILDGGHNDEGAKALADTLEGFFEDKKVLMVSAILANKEIDKMIPHMARVAKDVIVTMQPHNPRAMDSAELAEHFAKHMNVVAVTKSPAEAVEEALSRAEEYDAIVFAGSLYLIGEVRGILTDGGHEYEAGEYNRGLTGNWG